MSTPKGNSPDRRAEVLQKLEAGFTAVRDSERFREYLTVAAKFHKYSVCNTLLIFCQRPDASRVAGFHTWLSIERHVRKGEKGIMILAPCPWKKVEETEDGEEEIAGIYFKPVHVFDVSQTDGKDLPAIATDLSGEDDGLYERLEAVAASEGLSINREPQAISANGYYDWQHKTIWVKPDASPLQSAKTLAHEMAHHFAGHTGASDPEKETIAEASAYVVMSHAGLDSGDYSFDYLACWSDQKLFKAALGQVLQTANRIIEGLGA